MTQLATITEQPAAQHKHGLQAASLALFDGAAAAHGLQPSARRLLQLAATYYAAARQSHPERADRIGRDLALAAPISGLTADDQAIVAGAIALLRDKARPHREPAFLRLGQRDQQTALILAAILRIADQLTSVPLGGLSVHVDSGATTLIVGGERVDEAVEALETRAGLWRSNVGPLTIRAAALDEHDLAMASPVTNDYDSAAIVDLLLPLPGTADSIGSAPIAEEARRMLRRFFDKLLAREDAVRKDEDPEDVHQMRVATRRLRASLQASEGIYDPKVIRRYRRGLRRVAQALGAVRDGDVFLGHVVAYRDSLPEAERASLEPLIAAVTAERAQARTRLLKDLEAKRYKKFKRAFATFLTTPGAGVLAPPEPGIIERVRDFAGSAIWRRYELWRAYEVLLPNATDEALHQARIAGKRLRYTLEFFAEALGPNVEQELAPLVALQENLGTLQDGVAARTHMAALGMGDDPGAQRYLTAREAERATLLAGLPRLWEKVASATYRRRLFELIVKL